MKKITLFEPLFQELRIRKILPYLKKDSVLVDIGCDQPQVFIDRIKDDMKACIGIDCVVSRYSYGNVRILCQDLQKKIDFPSQSADIVTMMAVLEHMKHPKDIVRECFRILKKGGMLLITVPSPSSKPLLDLFAKVGLVRKEMIEQHENYFTEERLRKVMKNVGFQKVNVQMFEFGFNTFCKAVK
ncbi:MAG: class I SAM-dependent methyltransferase [Candidatus Pacebacteria bacterium]|nr:class I SAM-dependent methyltransferase [Candidatus Paceibacterota bacterium]